MSAAGLVPYSVNLTELKSFAGSKDGTKLHRILDLFKREIAENSDLHRQAIADGAPTLTDALGHLCAGIPPKGFGAQYVYALEILCAHFGQKLRNSAVYPIDDDWPLRVVDPIFDAWKLGDFLSFKRLIYGAWPLKLPHAGFPRGGTNEPDDITRALTIMRTGALPRFDQEVVALIGEVRGWLESASPHHSALICFYY